MSSIRKVEHYWSNPYLIIIMKLITLKFAAIFLIISACQSESNYERKEVLNKVRLFPADSITLEEVGLPYQLIKYDSKLLIVDEKLEQFIHVFDLKSNSYVGKVGNRGKGPGELLIIYGNADVYDGNLWFYDFKLSKLLGYNLDSLIQLKIAAIEHKIPVDLGLFDLDIVSQESIVGYGNQSEVDVFSIYNRQTGKISGFGKLPEKKNKRETIQIFKDAYDGILQIKPDKSKIAFAHLYGNILTISDIMKDTTKEIRVGEFFNPKYHIERRSDFSFMVHDEDARVGYRDLVVTDDYIITLFSGMTRVERYQKGGYNQVRVFNWEGELLRCYEVNRGVTGVAFDSVNKQLFTIQENEIPSILIYNLDL